MAHTPRGPVMPALRALLTAEVKLHLSPPRPFTRPGLLCSLADMLTLLLTGILSCLGTAQVLLW